MPPSRDPRPRPQNLTSNPNVGLCPSSNRSTRLPQPLPPELTALIQRHPQTSPISLPSPPSPSEGHSQIVAMGPQSSERKWLTREDLHKLPKIPKIKCGAEATPTSPSVSEPKPMFTISTPATLRPMTPPEYSSDFGQRLKSSGSEIIKSRCTSPSALQMEKGMAMTMTPQWSIFPQRSTGPNSTQATPINGSSCSESSRVFSLPLTPPLTPTVDSPSPSLYRNVDARESTVPSSMKGSTKVQERDSLDMPRKRSGVQSTLRSELKKTNERPRTQKSIPDLQGTFPLKGARMTSSQVRKSSPLACTMIDSSGGTTRRVASSPPMPLTSAQQTRSSKEFNMDSYNSCDCRSDGGQECMYCRILKGAFEFCKRVDHTMKGR